MHRVTYPTVRLIPALPAELSPNFLASLDAVDFALVRRTNSTWDRYVCAELSHRVHSVVSEYVSDSEAFFQLCQASGTVIAGLAALHILFPSHHPPRTLELFLPREAYDVVETHFRRSEHYGVPPPADVLDDDGKSVAEGGQVGHHGRTVHLIQSRSECALHPLVGELHSALFNYIGPSDFASAYPLLVRRSRGLLNPARLDGWRNLPDTGPLQDAVESWLGGGWEMSVEWRPWSPVPKCSGVHSAGCAAASRWFGDRFCASGPALPVRDRTTADQRRRNDAQTPFWWRGGFTCAPGCHSGVRLLVPGARVVDKELVTNM
ncbi:hypothetical protein OH76DRAFT_1340968 [Lentinus brumalis]|uniref:Uncharacterized protein n=1 Tax=Lentinus brumalis TaxID=2498619 RepID=A0A371DQ74_9APHY|nr:hypothetical protein OH76DRAFT_1340968 [Polyporus brumalis]